MWITYLLISLAILLFVLFLRAMFGITKKDGMDSPMIKAVAGSTYFARTNEFKIYNRFAKPNGIVFVGDSLTQRYPLNEFYPGFPVYNRGIDGDTTIGVLKRLDLSIFDLKPKMVVLQIGTNDLQVANEPKETTVKNIQTIIETIHAQQPNLTIILVSLYPVHEVSDRLVNQLIVGPRKNQDIHWMNDQIRTLKGVTFVDVYPSLLDEDGQLNMQYSKEGLHLSLAGYAVITPLIKSAIERLL
jgi:lysophospholipase L1-like esterase